MNIWTLSGFSCTDLVAGLINYKEGKAEMRLVVCSAYLPYDSEESPPSREFEEPLRYREEHVYLVIQCDSNSHHMVLG